MNGQNALISVIVPVYNVERYVETCLKSIANQTYSNIEVVIIDDGSPDDSVNICREFCEKDSRFHLYSKKNGGLSSARNFGLRYIHGDYTIFVDSDDTIMPNMFEELVSRMKEGVDVVCCGIRRVRQDGSHIDTFTKSITNPVCSGVALRSMLRSEGIQIGAYSKLVRTNLIQNNDIRFEEGVIHEDLLYTVSVLDAARQIVITGLPLYNYYSRAGSITHSSFSPRKMIVLDHLKTLEDFIQLHYPQLTPDVWEYESNDLWHLTLEASHGNGYKKYPVLAGRVRYAFFSRKKVSKIIRRKSFKQFALWVLVRMNIYRFIRR